MSRRVLARSGLALATTIAALLALEIPAYLGWVDWSDVVGLPPALRFTRLKPWANPVNLRDDELGFRHRPLYRFQGETPGDLVDLYGIATDRRYTADVAYDENGFRNPPGLRRADLVVVGDSFVEAGLVQSDETACARLGDLLSTSVANLGHSGYGPAQELVVLRRYGIALAPKTVVWVFFEGNDLLDVGRWLDAHAGKGNLDPSATRFRDRSLLHNLGSRIAVAFERHGGEDAPEARARRGVFTRTTPPLDLYFAFAGEPLTSEDLAHLEPALQSIRAGAELARAHGARFLLAYAPIKFRVYQGLCTFSPDSLPAKWSCNDLPARVARACADAGIDFLDLTSGLRAAAERGELVYFQDDGHWNSKGQEVVARLLAERLPR
jgi:hypothetical protein